MASIGVSFFPEGDRLLRSEVTMEISKADFLDCNLKLVLDRKAIWFRDKKCPANGILNECRKLPKPISIIDKVAAALPIS